MNFLQLACQRRSVRAYSSELVSEADLTYVLRAALRAPSAVNRQPWSILLLKSTQARAAAYHSYPRQWFVAAPLYLLVCSRPDEAWSRPADYKNHADIDVAILTEHICLAAADIGLGSCWVCNFNPDVLRKELSLPSEEVPVVLIPLGHPADQPGTPTARRSISDVVREM